MQLRFVIPNIYFNDQLSLSAKHLMESSSKWFILHSDLWVTSTRKIISSKGRFQNGNYDYKYKFTWMLIGRHVDLDSAQRKGQLARLDDVAFYLVLEIQCELQILNWILRSAGW